MRNPGLALIAVLCVLAGCGGGTMHVDDNEPGDGTGGKMSGTGGRASGTGGAISGTGTGGSMSGTGGSMSGTGGASSASKLERPGVLPRPPRDGLPAELKPPR